MLFGITTESCSASQRNRVHLRPDSPTDVVLFAQSTLEQLRLALAGNNWLPKRCGKRDCQTPYWRRADGNDARLLVPGPSLISADHLGILRLVPRLRQASDPARACRRHTANGVPCCKSLRDRCRPPRSRFAIAGGLSRHHRPLPPQPEI